MQSYLSTVLYLPHHYILFPLDLMQGINPADAFASLPSSMRGADELDDGLSVQDTSDPTPSVSSSVTTNPSNVLEDDSPMCLLHREEVSNTVQSGLYVIIFLLAVIRKGFPGS